ncbi:19617_t:CDS:1, partial [Gigaspora margarita]
KLKKNQKYTNQKTRTSLMIKIEIPEEQLPELEDEEFPKMDQRMKRLASYKIQILIKYKENPSYNDITTKN